MKTSTIMFHLATDRLTLVAIYAIWVAVALYEGEGIPVGEMIIFGCVMAVLYVVYVRRYGPQGILLRPRTTARQRCDALISPFQCVRPRAQHRFVQRVERLQ